MPCIQKLCRSDFSKTKSMPESDARFSRPESPRLLFSDESATKTLKTLAPILTAGPLKDKNFQKIRPAVIKRIARTVGRDESMIIGKLDQSLYEILATMPVGEGTEIHVVDLVDLIDKEHRRKIGIFRSIPPEGHTLSHARGRTFLLPRDHVIEENDEKILYGCGKARRTIV